MAIESPENPIRRNADDIRRHVQQTHKISNREFAVMLLVVEGHSNKIIAYRLGLAEGTVKVHLRTVFGKIGARNRTQVATWMINQGLTLPPAMGSADGSADASTLICTND